MFDAISWPHGRDKGMCWEKRASLRHRKRPPESQQSGWVRCGRSYFGCSFVLSVTMRLIDALREPSRPFT